MRVAIDGHNYLDRDCKTMAVINTNTNARKQTLASRKAREEQTASVKRHENDINIIKKAISEIKNSLNNLTGTLSNILTNLDITVSRLKE